MSLLYVCVIVCIINQMKQVAVISTQRAIRNEHLNISETLLRS
jgi:hypothetical protein